MPITAAEIEDNGWVLRLTLSAGAGGFGSYALDPNGTPRLMVGSSHAGFVRSGGQAVAGSLARQLVATRPLRRPVDPAQPSLKAIDETDLGGGNIRVRLALSEHVYATDTGLALTALAGWRTGEAAATLAVTNTSTTAAPLPILRWALPSYGTTGGPIRLALVAVSHHPQGLDPVAAVRFTATDDTNSRSLWVTAQGIDPSLGDGLNCYTAVIDGSGLNPGLLRCDAEVYPWLGAMRSTDPVGTRSMASLRTDGWSAAAEAPFVIGHDPAGTRYGAMWAYVDPVNGTTTASAAMVQASLAAAKGVAPASRPRDINTARQAGYLFNRTLAAANGQAAQTRSLDGMVAVLAPGTHTAHGSTAVTTGAAEAEIPFRIMGDPDDANPRANCIIQTTVAQLPARATRLRYENLTIAAGTNSLSGATTYVAFDQVTVQGRSGLETSTTALMTAAPPAGQVNVAVTRSRFWRYGVGITSGNARCGLFRGNEMSAQVQAQALLRCRWIAPAEDGFVGAAIRQVSTGWANATLAAQVEDVIHAWNDWRSVRARVWAPGVLPAATAGTPNPSIRRNVFLGNVCERVGTDPSPFYSLGEDVSVSMTYNIIEANSFIGDRANTLYSDPLPVTVADTDSQRNQALVNRVVGNAFDWWPTKHDDFADSTTQSVRASAGIANATGYRPQMVEAWSALYGVGAQGNADLGRTGAGNFALEWPGLGSVQTVNGVPAFANDASLLGSGGGGGDYRVAATSPLAGRVGALNGDRDANGQARRLPATAGAFAANPAALAPAGARSTQRAASPPLGLGLAVNPGGAASGQSAGSPVLAWTATLTTDPARQAQLAAMPPLALALALAPAPARQPHRAAAPRLDWLVALAGDGAAHALASGPALLRSDSLLPDTAQLRTSDAGGIISIGVAATLVPGHDRLRLFERTEPLLLPGSLALRSLIIGADPRRLTPERD